MASSSCKMQKCTPVKAYIGADKAESVTFIKPLEAIRHDTIINSWQHQSSHNHRFQNSRYGGEETHRKTKEKPEIREQQVDVSRKKSMFYFEMIMK